MLQRKDQQMASCKCTFEVYILVIFEIEVRQRRNGQSLQKQAAKCCWRFCRMLKRPWGIGGEMTTRCGRDVTVICHRRSRDNGAAAESARCAWLTKSVLNQKGMHYTWRGSGWWTHQTGNDAWGFFFQSIRRENHKSFTDWIFIHLFHKAEAFFNRQFGGGGEKRRLIKRGDAAKGSIKGSWMLQRQLQS